MSCAALLARTLVGLALLAGTPAAGAAEGAGPRPRACAERAFVVARLASGYGETLRSVGLVRADGRVEVYASARTGTWTILFARPDGTACLLAAGHRWDEAAKPGEDA